MTIRLMSLSSTTNKWGVCALCLGSRVKDSGTIAGTCPDNRFRPRINSDGSAGYRYITNVSGATNPWGSARLEVTHKNDAFAFAFFNAAILRVTLSISPQAKMIIGGTVTC